MFLYPYWVLVLIIPKAFNSALTTGWDNQYTCPYFNIIKSRCNSWNIEWMEQSSFWFNLFINRKLSHCWSHFKAQKMQHSWLSFFRHGPWWISFIKTEDAAPVKSSLSPSITLVISLSAVHWNSNSNNGGQPTWGSNMILSVSYVDHMLQRNFWV